MEHAPKIAKKGAFVFLSEISGNGLLEILSVEVAVVEKIFYQSYRHHENYTVFFRVWGGGEAIKIVSHSTFCKLQNLLSLV